MLDTISPDPLAEVTIWFAVVSQRVPAGTTSQAWLAAYESYGPRTVRCWPDPANMEQATIGGQKAWIHGGLPGCGFTEAIVFAGGRVYLLTGFGGSFFDRAMFEALVSTITFDPAKADDTPVH